MTNGEFEYHEGDASGEEGDEEGDEEGTAAAFVADEGESPDVAETNG